MRLVVYGAVLAITLGNVLLGLDWLSAPMAPMVNTEAGLRAPAALLPPAAKTGASDLAAPVVVPPTAPNAKSGAPNIGARIIPPGLTAPTTSNVPTSVGTEVQTTPPEPIRFRSRKLPATWKPVPQLTVRSKLRIVRICRQADAQALR